METNKFNAQPKTGNIVFKVAYECSAEAYADKLLQEADMNINKALRTAARLSRKQVMAELRRAVLVGEGVPKKAVQQEQPQGYELLLGMLKDLTQVKRRGQVVNG
ncbi:MAG: hypothetical protein R8M45_06575 [Ghiorsea sp.]